MTTDAGMAQVLGGLRRGEKTGEAALVHFEACVPVSVLRSAPLRLAAGLQERTHEAGVPRQRGGPRQPARAEVLFPLFPALASLS